MSRSGSVIVVDNVVRGGAVADAQATDAAVIGTRKLIELSEEFRTSSATQLRGDVLIP